MRFNVTVNLLIEADTESEACDTTNEILRESLQQFHPASSLLDYGVNSVEKE